MSGFRFNSEDYTYLTSVPDIDAMGPEDIFTLLFSSYEYHFRAYRVPLIFNIDIEVFLNFNDTSNFAEGVAMFLTHITGNN